MASVRDILIRKGREVLSVAPDATVLDAARLMNDRGVGGLLVLEGETLVGIFTERDILRRVVADQRDPATTPIREVMTSSVMTCSPETTVEQCGTIMTTRRIRHLPVLGVDGLAGLVSSGDLLAYQVDEQQATIQELNRYIYDLR